MPANKHSPASLIAYMYGTQRMHIIVSYLGGEYDAVVLEE